MTITSMSLVLQLAALVVAGLIGYFSAYNALNARVSVLEAQWVGLSSDVKDIKTDVRTLLERR